MSSNFAPSPAELALVNQIFNQFDTQKVGILTGDIAVKVFDGAKLPPTVLGEIWGIADDENNGFLTKKGVAVALRLIAWAQKGDKVSKALVNKPGPLATIQGVHAPLVPQSTGISSPKSPPPGLPVLTPQDKTKYNKLFQSSGPVNGILSGDKARDVFFKSNLPVEKLSQIWNLADTQDRGSLDATDFTIAMYLIQGSMSGQLSFIPSSLPPGLYEQAGGKPSNDITAQVTGGSRTLRSPVSNATTQVSRQATAQPLQPQSTGQTKPPAFAPGIPTRHPAGPSIQTQSVAQWDVTQAEKVSADRFFDTLDTQKKGYIEGDVAVPFMLQSKLPEDILAQVWDLADINNDGRLTRDGFAVAMHLIQGKLTGKEVPSVLPQTLVPPSMRAGGSPFAAHSKPHELIKDLLWDDSPPSSAGNVNSNDLQAQFTETNAHFIPPRSAQPAQLTRSVDPFEAPAFHKDLLGDDEDTTVTQLHDRSAEVGNAQNQLNSTNRSLQTSQAERENLETILANQAAQLSALQTQLSSAKAAYDTETTLLGSLRERYSTQTAEIQKVREELIRAESDLSAMRVEKAEIEGSVLRDKEEVRGLNRKMIEVGTEMEGLKAEIEKWKKDAKQQKGLIAIAKKQLASKEAERHKVEKEVEETQDDLATATREREDVDAVLQRITSTPPTTIPERVMSPVDSLRFAAAQPLPMTPEPTSSASPRSNNPFERLTMSSGTPVSRPHSPLFSFTTAATPTPPVVDAVATSQPIQDDPFGFSGAFEGDAVAAETKAEPSDGAADFEATTPRVADLVPTGGIFGDMVASPSSDNEFFTTPPSTALSAAESQPADADVSHISSIDNAAAHFPAIDEMSTDLPAEAGQDHLAGETDLGSSLQELDADGSDSDSDSDIDEDDNKPLGVLKTASNPSSQEISEIETPKELAPAGTSFDDAFASDAPITSVLLPPTPTGDAASPLHNGAPVELDPFGVPVQKAPSPFEAPTNPAFSNDTSGLNAFDEGMNKISGSETLQGSSNFPFTAGFDDDFDFASASATSSMFPPPPASTNGNTSILNVAPNKDASPFAAPAQAMMPATAVSPIQPPKSAFEAAFSNGLWDNQPPVTSQPTGEQNVVGNGGASGVSFDDIFGGFDTSQSLKMDDSFSSRRFTTVGLPAPAEPVKTFPSVSPPTSLRGPTSPRVTSIRSSSPPPRSGSPPPRVSSPKQRPSTSSSHKDIPEKPVPPPRHSKLSIRLPFGKKKKQDSMPPPPIPAVSQHLRPVEEPATGTVTHAIEDDAEVVRQLTSMGFSRNQAVTSLEAHDYDLQRALNNLLGAQ